MLKGPFFHFRAMSLRPSQSHPSVSASMVNARGGASSSLGRPPHLATQLAYQQVESHYQYGTQQHHFVGEHMVQTASLSLNVPVRETTPQPLEIKTEIKEEPVDVASTSNQLLSQPPPEDDGEINIEIRNVVCNYTLPFHIELRRVALNSLNVQLDPGKGALVKQLRNPWCLIKIYNSGKVYIVGCRSELEAMRAARKVARCIQRSMDKLGKRICMRNYKICNVLATCRLPFGIKIEEMAQKYKEHSTYEPELSVGLVWRNKIPKATLRIHTTGSITVTGAQSEADVTTILTDIYEKVWEFRCADRNRSEKGTRKRKVNNQRSDGPSRKQQSFNRDGNQPTSGLVGNRVYFSDEDEDEDEEFFDEDEEDF